MQYDHYKGNISTRLSSNSEANTTELLENAFTTK